MRRLFIVMMALAFAFSMPTTSKAEPGRWRRAAYRPVRYYQPVRTYRAQPGPVRTMFSNLMELERRKNAWLAATFFGR